MFVLYFLATTKFDCNFDKKMICSWQQDPTATFKWTIHNRRTSSIKTGPTSDHTTGSAAGTSMKLDPE